MYVFGCGLEFVILVIRNTESSDRGSRENLNPVNNIPVILPVVLQGLPKI